MLTEKACSRTDNEKKDRIKFNSIFYAIVIFALQIIIIFVLVLVLVYDDVINTHVCLLFVSVTGIDTGHRATECF